MDVLISLLVMNILQCRHISNHQVIHLRICNFNYQLYLSKVGKRKDRRRLNLSELYEAKLGCLYPDFFHERKANYFYTTVIFHLWHLELNPTLTYNYIIELQWFLQPFLIENKNLSYKRNIAKILSFTFLKYNH